MKKYVLVVDWLDGFLFSTFFFDCLETAISERDRERSVGNSANVYELISD